MNHWAFPSQRSCMAHSHFAVVLGGESVGNEEHLPCTLPFLLSPHSSSPPPLEIPTDVSILTRSVHTHTSSIPLKCFVLEVLGDLSSLQRAPHRYRGAIRAKHLPQQMKRCQLLVVSCEAPAFKGSVFSALFSGHPPTSYPNSFHI